MREKNGVEIFHAFVYLNKFIKFIPGGLTPVPHLGYATEATGSWLGGQRQEVQIQVA